MTSKLSTGPVALRTVVKQVRLLFHQLAAVADDLHRDLHITAAQRAVLEALVEGGAAAVPTIARAKRVTRQHVQTIVNDLVDAGLVELADNPAHQRSQLVRPTQAGARAFDAICAREQKLLRSVATHLPARDLSSAARTLAELSSHLDRLATS